MCKKYMGRWNWRETRKAELTSDNHSQLCWQDILWDHTARQGPLAHRPKIQRQDKSPLNSKATWNTSCEQPLQYRFYTEGGGVNELNAKSAHKESWGTFLKYGSTSRAAVALFSYWFCAFTIHSISKETSISLFSKRKKKAVLVLIFCLTTLSHAQGAYTYNWNRATIKILHCHPVVNVSKTWGCSARRYGNDPLRNAEATQHSRRQLKHQELAPCYPGKQSRIPNDIISHFSSSNAMSSRDLSEDTQSTPKNTSSFKLKYSG